MDGLVDFFARQSLGQFIHQFLLALVFQLAGFVGVALHQFAQPLDPGISLLPGLTGLVQVVLMPHQTLALLANSRFQLPKEVMIVAQPLAGHTLTAAIDP